MKYVDEYRDPEHCKRLVQEIRAVATHPWTIMEVCGGQTHGLLRNGIDQQLEGKVRLIHGPGCPVCVTPLEAIDFAIELAQQPNIALTSFGDMLRVPGSKLSLMQTRAQGGDVRIVYSPLDAVTMAAENPNTHFVFFAVGFETTAPVTALAVQQAANRGLTNFSVLASHVCVLPAMEMLAASPDNSVQGFLAAGHVCTVAGYDCYEEFAAKYKLPVVVTGFEPVDLLTGILECVRQLERGESTVCNQYVRSVSAAGNAMALSILNEVYEPCSRPWRGIGIVPNGGLQLRAKWEQFDSRKRFPRKEQPVQESDLCRSAEVLIGRIRPTECEYFGKECTPEVPLGAPMVSAEGACAAYFRYGGNRIQENVKEGQPAS